MKSKDFYTLNEVCLMFDVDRRMVDKFVRQGKLKVYRLTANTIRVSADQIKTFLKRYCSDEPFFENYVVPHAQTISEQMEGLNEKKYNPRRDELPDTEMPSTPTEQDIYVPKIAPTQDPVEWNNYHPETVHIEKNYGKPKPNYPRPAFEKDLPGYDAGAEKGED